MTERVAGTDSYETEDYGTGTTPGHDAIVADRTGGSQLGVVDVNHGGCADVPSIVSDHGRVLAVTTR